VVALYTGAQAANAVNTGTAITFTAVGTGATEEFYNKVLVPLKVKLDEANVPTEGRWCVVPPWGHAMLLLSSLFSRFDGQGSNEVSRNGMVGRAAGFDILVSNNVPLITTDFAVIAGVDSALSFAEQINQTEAVPAGGEVRRRRQGPLPVRRASSSARTRSPTRAPPASPACSRPNRSAAGGPVPGTNSEQELTHASRSTPIQQPGAEQ
jgi:hypothetical protein